MQPSATMPLIRNLPETLYVDREDGELVTSADPSGFVLYDAGFSNLVAVYKLHGFVEVSIAVTPVEVAADVK